MTINIEVHKMSDLYLLFSTLVKCYVKVKLPLIIVSFDRM